MMQYTRSGIYVDREKKKKKTTTKKENKVDYVNVLLFVLLFVVLLMFIFT